MCFALLVNLLVRYPGDPQGQAWVGGARQYMAIKRVGGLDVACFWREEWQEMRFFHGWIGWELPIKSGYISYIWLLQSDYIIVGYWMFLADFEWWQIWNHLRASASQWDLSNEVSTWDFWDIMDLLDDSWRGNPGPWKGLGALERSLDMGWWLMTTNHTSAYFKVIPIIILRHGDSWLLYVCMYIYIYLDARFVCPACLTSSDPPSHLRSAPLLLRGMIMLSSFKMRLDKRVKTPPFLSKSIWLI